MKKTTGQRMFSVVAAAMLVLTSMETLIAQASIRLSDGETVDNDVTLLIGDNENNPYRAGTVAETIQNYTNNFALGIASQFCVFVSDFYVPHDSDAEGRVAIGSYFKNESPNNPHYEVGKGNYGVDGSTGNGAHQLEDLLEVDEESGDPITVRNYARIVWGSMDGTFYNYVDGETKTYVGPELLGIGWESYNGKDENNIAYAENDSEKNIGQYIKNNYTGNANDTISRDDYRGCYDEETSHFYDTGDSLIDFDAQFAMLDNRSTQIAKAKNQFQITDAYKMDIWDCKDSIVITVEYQGEDVPTETIYLNLNDSYYQQEVYIDDQPFYIDDHIATYYELFKKATIIRYENIPKLPESRKVVQSNGKCSVDWEYSYIVINDSSEGDVTAGWQNNWSCQYSTIKGFNEDIAVNISYVSGGAFLTWGKDGEAGGSNVYPVINSDGSAFLTNSFKDDIYQDGSNGVAHLNNDVGVTSILYNFPRADRVIIMGSMQGTILAPNSHTTDPKFLKNHGTPEEREQWNWVNDNNPHLSGALIAKSFEGNIEFGFRPFTGPLRILSASAEYRIGITKKDAEDGTNVSGAVFGIYAATNTAINEATGHLELTSTPAVFGNTPVDSVETSNAEEDFIELSSGYYVLKEVTAPVGYDITDDAYYFIVEDEEVIVYLTKSTSTNEYEVVDEDYAENHPDEIITVNFPKTTIIVCEDENFDRENPVAEYSYSAFRAAERTYQFNNGTIKFSITGEGGILEPGQIEDAIYTDENGVESHLNTENFQLVLVEGQDGYGYDPKTGTDVHYNGYIVIYTEGDTEQILQPIITLTRVIKQKDNEFNGFVFEDKKIIAVKKIDGVTNKLLSGATIDLTCDGVAVDGWTWDDATGQILLSKVQESDGNNNIYRLHESKVPTGYEDPTEDTIFAVMGDYLYIATVPVGEEPSADYFPVNTSNKWTKRDILNTIAPNDDGIGGNDAAANRVIEIANKKKGLTLQKVDKAGNQIDGATVELYANGLSDPIGTFTLGSSDLSGVKAEYVENGSLKPGVYYLIETAAPSGYKTDLVGQPLYFKVNSDSTISYYDLGDAIEFEVARTDDGSNAYWKQWCVVYNGDTLDYDWLQEPYKIGVNITRVEISFERFASNANFQIQISVPDSNNSPLYQSGILNIQADWGKYGEYGTGQIENDTFVYEFNEPVDFELFRFKVAGDVDVKSIKLYPESDSEDESSNIPSLIIDNDNLTLSIENELDGYQVGISKVGSENETEIIGGAEFELYTQDAKGEYTVLVGKYTSEDGKVLTMALEEGKKYKLVETKAPSGYTADPEPYYFEINADGRTREITETEDVVTGAKVYEVNIDGFTKPADGDIGTNPGQYLAAEKISAGAYKWESGISGLKVWGYPNQECLVDKVEFYCENGIQSFDNDWNGNFGQDWTNGYQDLKYYYNEEIKNNIIEKIVVTFKKTDVPYEIKIQITVNNEVIEFGNNNDLFTSSDENVEVTVFPIGSPEAKTYYKIVDATVKNKIEVSDPNNPNQKYWVEAETESVDNVTRVNTKKITLKVTHGETYGDAVYDTLALKNTYIISGEEYELTIDPTQMRILKDGVSFDLGGRLSVKKLDNSNDYVIFCDGEVIYPTFYDDDTLLLTRNLSNFDELDDGLVIVNTLKTTEEPKTVQISKVDATTEEELEGAELWLYTADDYQDYLDGHLTLEQLQEKAIDHWTSGTEAHEVTDIEAGDYVIVETVAPDGYTITTAVAFNVDEDGQVTGNTVKDGVVLVKDDLSEITISKKDFADKGKANAGELSGAEFTLTYNGEGNFELVDYDKNAGGNYITINKTSKTITWTSTDKATVFKGLPDGEYTLTETSAPSEYDGLTATITFTIENGVITESRLSDESESQYVDRSGNVITVYNTEQVFSGEMPATGFGGIARTVLQVLGFIVLMATVFVLLLKKRRQNNNPQTA